MVTGASRCWAGEEPGRTEWRRWWMRDYCWSLVGMGLGCDPEKRQNREKLHLNLSPGDFASFSQLALLIVGLFMNHTTSF